MHLVLSEIKCEDGKNFIDRRIEISGYTLTHLGQLEVIQKDGEDYETAKNRTIEEAKNTKIRLT